jgi:hypothetical protein
MTILLFSVKQKKSKILKFLAKNEIFSRICCFEVKKTLYKLISHRYGSTYEVEFMSIFLERTLPDNHITLEEQQREPNLQGRRPPDFTQVTTYDRFLYPLPYFPYNF